jgi:WD40 repeat protein
LPSGENSTTTASDGNPATAAAGQGLRVWDLERLEVLATLPKSGTGPGECLCFAPDDQRIAIGNRDSTLEVWNLARKEPVVTEWKAHNGVSGMCFMPKGNQLVTVGWDSKARLWDLETQQDVAPFGRTLNAYTSVAASPDGERIATGDSNGLIKIWDSKTGQELATLRAAKQSLVRLAFLRPDGNTLISATSQEARLWRAPSWAEIEAAEAREKHDAQAQ